MSDVRDAEKQCWICGNPADSREHKVKASDVRQFFGRVTRDSPIYYQGGPNSNIPVGSAKSKRLKTDSVICRRCNDTLTVPYDRAWETLSSFIFKHWDAIKKRRRVKLQRVFPGNTRRQSANVQLFFAKPFGCRIINDKMPIDIEWFSRSVANGIPHPDLYLTFTIATFSPRLSEYAALSQVHALQKGGVCQRATWYCTLGEFSVQVTWALPDHKHGLSKTWTAGSGKVIRFHRM